MDVVDRMVDGYEIKHAIYIGNKEILLGMDEAKPDAPYMVCDCIWDNPLGIDRYDNAVGSADYFEIMTEFLARAQAQLEAVKAERVETPIPLFTKEHCTPNDYSQSIEDKVVVIRPECLLPEYRTAVKQLVLATGLRHTWKRPRPGGIHGQPLFGQGCPLKPRGHTRRSKTRIPARLGCGKAEAGVRKAARQERRDPER